MADDYTDYDLIPLQERMVKLIDKQLINPNEENFILCTLNENQLKDVKAFILSFVA
jgi:hypothetical protein